MTIRQKTVRLLSAAALAAAGLAAGPLVTAAHAAAAPVNFYVSPTGSDSNAGTTLAAPFQTLAKAQTAVRAVDQATAGAITVNLAGGDYRLSKPLTFTAADSATGTAGDITWKAEPGAFPVVSGGDRITGWKLTDTAKNIWTAPAPTGLDTRQLYVNGSRAVRATGSVTVKLTRTDRKSVV